MLNLSSRNLLDMKSGISLRSLGCRCSQNDQLNAAADDPPQICEVKRVLSRSFPPLLWISVGVMNDFLQLRERVEVSRIQKRSLGRRTANFDGGTVLCCHRRCSHVAIAFFRCNPASRVRRRSLRHGYAPRAVPARLELVVRKECGTRRHPLVSARKIWLSRIIPFVSAMFRTPAAENSRGCARGPVAQR